MKLSNVEEVVREKYGAVGASALTGEDAGVRAVAEAFGYTSEELDSIPAAANMGLSCGNPTATANLKAGEVIVDLGSGGGLDVFLASRKVGPTGKAIGIDMTPEMVERAKTNAKNQGFTNVDFHLATIDKLPLPNESVDCVISNCVINLASDKAAVLREVYRVLKPGGRVAVSDIALKKELPGDVKKDLMAYVGCVAGAVLISEYIEGLKAAGFSAVQVVDTKKDLNAYAQVDGQGACCTPEMETLSLGNSSCDASSTEPSKPIAIESSHVEPKPATVHSSLAALLSKYDINEFAASVQVYAVKPQR